MSFNILSQRLGPVNENKKMCLYNTMPQTVCLPLKKVQLTRFSNCYNDRVEKGA